MTELLMPGKFTDGLGGRGYRRSRRDGDRQDIENLESDKLIHAINHLFESYQFSHIDYLNKGIALTESQQILIKVFNNLPWMIFRCRYDDRWTVEFVSRGSLKLTGYHPMDLILDRDVTLQSMIHQEDWSMVRNRIDASLSSKQPYDLMHRIITKEGEEKWVRGLGYGIFSYEGNISALEGIMFDITSQKQVEDEIQQHIRQIQALRKIDLAITSSFDLRIPLEVLLDQVIGEAGVDAADIYFYDGETDQLLFAGQRGFKNPQQCPSFLPLEESLAGEIVLTQQTIYEDKLASLNNHYKYLDVIKKEQFAAYIGVPLVVKGQVRGILEAYTRENNHADRDRVDFLEALGAQAAIAIDNKTMYENLQHSNQELAQAYDATLEGWSKALELRDQETEGHTRRVTELTLRLARAMGVKGDNLVDIRRGALLHDIGKVGIPDSILTKSGPLTESEWQIMRQHPIYAYQLLSPVEYLRYALDIPYCHHERWDGSGYPQGLKGKEIPLFARIFTVADVWDALLSERPYRKAWTKEEARAYLIEQSGKQFDPEVVKVFIELISEDK